MRAGEHWYKEAIIYELHVKCFHDSSGSGYGDFRGLTKKLDYLQQLGITAIWLLPFYPSPLRDDGYDIANYTDVHPQYGNLNDFKHFLSEAHKRGLRVITELVINHTSDQHPWFQRARRAKKGSKYWNYYVWCDSADKYKDSRIIFQDFESSNWTWDPIAKSYYWHRFYSHQPDLNFDNPEVHQIIFKKLSFWLKLGVDGVRLDAVPYLYEREGTVCENLPETHDFLKKLRAYVDAHFEDKMLLAEANQWPEDAAKYFGEGDECQMAFHFPVMPRLFMGIHLEDSLPITEIMEQTPKIPSNCQWALFLRNHDELTLEMVTDEERDYMFRVYAHDPQARVNLGIRRRLAPLLKNDRRKIELMNSLLFSLTGTPVIYYGDELGMGDNIYLGDRDGVRTPMQWSNDRNAGFSRVNPQQLYLPPIIDPEYHYETLNVEAQLNNPYSLLWWTKQLISLRKRFKAFSYGTTEFLVNQNRKLLIFFREYDGELLMIISNLSRFAQYVELDLKKYEGYSLVEIFSGGRFPTIGELPYFLTLGPYGYYWFTLEKQSQEAHALLVNREKEKLIFQSSFQTGKSRIFHLSMRSTLLNMVIKYLNKRIWFKDYAALLDRTKTRILDHLFLSKQEAHLIFIEITLTSGLVHQFPLFLRYLEGVQAQEKIELFPEHVVVEFVEMGGQAILFDLAGDNQIEQRFLDVILKNKRIRSENGEMKGVSFLKETETENIEKKVEIFPVIDEGMNLDIEIRLFLMQKTSFSCFFPAMGYVEYKTEKYGGIALAQLVPSHQEKYNAKELAVEAADHFLMRMESTFSKQVINKALLPSKTLFGLAASQPSTDVQNLIEEYLEVMHLLGEITASFHQAMNSDPLDPNFALTPFTLFYQRSIYQTMRRKVLDGFSILESNQNPELKRDINKLGHYKNSVLELLQIIPHRKLHAERMRYHGDFKLENLQYTGTKFLIANFGGNPLYSYNERKYKRSPLIDCASLLLSLADAAVEATRQIKSRGHLGEDEEGSVNSWAHIWSLWVGSSFLRAYFKKLGNASFLPENTREIDFLLGIFLIEQCFERIAMCDQIEAPIAMLLHWLPIYENFTLK